VKNFEIVDILRRTNCKGERIDEKNSESKKMDRSKRFFNRDSTLHCAAPSAESEASKLSLKHVERLGGKSGENLPNQKKRTCNSVPSRRKKNFVIFFNNKKYLM
jgi:hypothetical protein